MTSTEFWNHFESRISKHFPEKLKLLPAGASTIAIQEAENLMGVTLPESVREFYRRHDGSGPFCFEPWSSGPQWFLSLQSMTYLGKAMCEIGLQFEGEPELDFGTQEGPIKRRHWSPRWIPITENQCGDYINLDLDPAEGGTVGQVIDWWHECAQSKWVSPSFLDWLQDIVDALETGTTEIKG